jgi:hypothetical protein
MKNLVFNSVAGRSILVLLIGLSISHVASLLVYTAERGVDHAPHRRDAANGAS